MSWGATVLLVLFGVFIVLVIVNPNVSCFGKRLRSPFYPLLRKKAPPKKTTDYHFHLVDGTDDKKPARNENEPLPKTEDYGFRRD
jgi:hypothetical protein